MSEPRIEMESEESEVEELREVLKAVSQFVSDLKEPIKEIIAMLMNALDGKKLGEEVAQFYRKLVDSGVPEDMARELTKEFFQKKLESAPKLSSLIDMLSNVMKVPKPPKRAEAPSRESETRVENQESKEAGSSS